MSRPHIVAALAGTLLTAASSTATAQVFDTQMAGWFANIQRSISALRVSTRQDALRGEQTANSGQNAAQGLASVIVEQETATRIHRAVNRSESMHNSLTTGLCTTAETQETANAASEAVENLNAEFGGFEQRWIERGGSRSDTLIATHEMRRTVFCTDSEQERGLCEGPGAFGVPPAGDSNAAPFLLRRSYGSAEVDVGSVFVDTVAPFPTIQPSDEATSVSELIDRAAARRELALVALARAGLTDVLVRGVQGGVAE